jgi:uncharacterized protein DUF2589
MAEIEALDNVLRAIHNAVLEAHKLTEQQHQRQLRRYFNEDGTPVIQKIRVPDIRPNASEEYREIEVPVLALFPPSAIRIKDLTMNFRVRIVGFSDEAEPHKGFQAVPSEKESHSGPLRVMLGQRDRIDEENVATITINFGEIEPPEAFNRIVDLLSVKLP